MLQIQLTCLLSGEVGWIWSSLTPLCTEACYWVMPSPASTCWKVVYFGIVRLLAVSQSVSPLNPSVVGTDFYFLLLMSTKSIMFRTNAGNYHCNCCEKLFFFLKKKTAQQGILMLLNQVVQVFKQQIQRTFSLLFITAEY